MTDPNQGLCGPHLPGKAIRGSLGFRPSAFLKNDDLWVSQIHREDRASALAAACDAERTGVLSIKYRWQCANGMEKRFLDRGIVSPSLDDRSSKLVGVCVEITEHAALTRLLRELGAAGMAMVPPAGDVSESDILHALHNLLTVIIWNLERSVWRMQDDGTPWAAWMALHMALTTAIAPQRPPHPLDMRRATSREPKAITVLLVEDDDDVRGATAARLEDMGHHVLTVDSAEAALDLLAGDAAVDLVLSDVNLPRGMSGIDLARRAVELRSRIKFVFVSGNKLSRETEREPYGEVLLKPYRREDLAGAMMRALGEASRSSTADGHRI